MESPRPSKWEDACTAAAILAVDPVGIVGISMRCSPGPVRDLWLSHLAQMESPQTHVHRVPLHVTDGRLLGGLDLGATLRAGKPVAERGILAAADGGIVVLAMAERLTAVAAAKITSVLDRHAIVLEREGFGSLISSRFRVIALDEGIDADERPPPSLLDRLALHVELNGVPLSLTGGIGYSPEDIDCARRRVSDVSAGEAALAALCETAGLLGIDSARAPWFALRVARATAALAGRCEVVEEDLALAARLVFAPRATKAPAPPGQSQQPPAQQPTDATHTSPEPPSETAPQPMPQTETASGTPAEISSELTSEKRPDSAQDTGQEQSSLTPAEQTLNTSKDRVLEAVRAALPPDLLTQVQFNGGAKSSSRQSGRAGVETSSRLRGRPAGIGKGDPNNGGRMNVIETLRAAAPWQRIRRALVAASPGTATPLNNKALIHVRKEDFRVTRFKRRTRTTTIFLVDASGSAALNRLAEVKGAVELMLAQSYVRRDRVALIAFRGNGARLLLPPTGSLVRAKRELASLPGGGGTPLASGLDAARILADSIRRRGETPMVVLLTDGRPNVARDGTGSRKRAEDDAVNAARRMRLELLNVLLVDTAPQPRLLTESLAHEMRARYVPLPHADAGTLAGIVHRSGSAGSVEASRR